MKFKVLLAAVAMLAISQAATVHADDDNQDSVTGLKFVMKDMGAQMKTLVAGLIQHKPVSLTEMQAAADKLLVDAKDAKGRLPTQLVDAQGQPLPDKQKEIQQYQSIMDDLITASEKLSSMLKAGDTQTAGKVLSDEMASIKKHGHEIFNPPPPQ